MELVIGCFVVMPFPAIKDAAGVHTELQKRGIDAAVVDHAYILSKLQLATALSRITPFHGVTASAVSSSKQRTASVKGEVARLLFLSLSLTHNLDRVLQILPPGPATSAVVVILHKQAATPEALDSIREVCGRRKQGPAPQRPCGTCGGGSGVAEAPRSSSPEDVEAFVYHTLAAFADAAKLKAFYGVTEKELLTVRQGFTSQDVQRSEAMARRCGAEKDGVDPKLLLNTRALELCVVNRLATTDI